MANEQFDWPVKPEAAPVLPAKRWLPLNILGVFLVVMGLAQIFSFTALVNSLDVSAIGPARLWAALIILAELWAAAGFFRIRLSRTFRAVSNFLALFVGLFWLYVTLRQLSGDNIIAYFIEGQRYRLTTDFFGRYTAQTPSWWTVIEASVLIFWILFGLQTLEGTIAEPKVKVTRVNKRGTKNV